MTQTSFELCVFEKDYRLSSAWKAYQAVTEAFKRTYNRQPVCDLYIGAIGERETQRSVVTIRWTDIKGAEDAQLIVNLYAALNA